MDSGTPAEESPDADLDPDRFEVHRFDGRGFGQAFVRVNPGGVPLLCVHGWPETKRIWWRAIAPLAAAGFEVIVPDLRGFGESDVGPDGFHDVPSHSRDLHALVTDGLGHERVVLCGGDLGGPVVQDFALRFPEATSRMALFNSPLPYDKQRMADMDSRVPAGSSDYFLRQATDPDGLAAELATPQQRRAYIATFYTSRFWAHPGAFTSGTIGGQPLPHGPAVDFHTEPFGDAETFRASLGGYESTVSSAARSEPPLVRRNPDVEALILFGPSDHVLYPDFDRMAAVVFPDHVGPFLLRDCGHFVPWEAPHALTSALRVFARDLLAG